MVIKMQLHELKDLCQKMSELGAAQYQKSLTPVSDVLSQREAYRQFGEGSVKRWVSAGLVSGHREGAKSGNSPKRYSRTDLMAASQAERLNKIINR
jgi:hypothetical protein